MSSFTDLIENIVWIKEKRRKKGKDRKEPSPPLWYTTYLRGIEQRKSVTRILLKNGNSFMGNRMKENKISVKWNKYNSNNHFYLFFIH